MDASGERGPRSKAAKSTSPRRTFRRRDARAGSPFLLVPMDVAPGLWHGTPRGAGREKIERVRRQRLPAPDKEREMRATASTRASVRSGEARGRCRQYAAHHVVLEVEPGDRGPGGSRGRGTADRERERRLDRVLGEEPPGHVDLTARRVHGAGRQAPARKVPQGQPGPPPPRASGKLRPRPPGGGPPRSRKRNPFRKP